MWPYIPRWKKRTLERDKACYVLDCNNSYLASITFGTADQISGAFDTSGLKCSIDIPFQPQCANLTITSYMTHSIPDDALCDLWNKFKAC